MLGKPCWSSYEMYPISGYFSKLGAHLTMLSDRNRIRFYENALKKAIIPNKSVVLDIGTGTGILAMIAARYGAKKVYAIEYGDIINVAKKIIEDNGLGERIKLIKGLSTEVNLPEKVDIIVSETMGFTGLEENIEEIMGDAKKRFSKENTIFIPDNINVFVTLCTDSEVRKRLIDVWDKPFYDLDFSFLSKLSKQNIFTRQRISNSEIISKPKVIYSAALGGGRSFRKQVIFSVEDDSTVEGLVGWFSVASQHSIHLSSFDFGRNGHWQQFFVPLRNPIRVKRGENFIVKLSKGQPFRWRILYVKNDGTSEKFLIQNDVIIKTLKGLK